MMSEHIQQFQQPTDSNNVETSNPQINDAPLNPSTPPTTEGLQPAVNDQNEDERGNSKPCVTVIDPLNRKLELPIEQIIPTKASQRQGTTSSLCLLHLEGRCRQGSECNQVHADPEFIKELRKSASAQPLCCQKHGDIHAKSFKYFPHWNDKTITIDSVVIPIERLAFTQGLQRSMVDDGTSRIFISPLFVCKLHAGGNCRYGEECKFVHVCREFVAEKLSSLVQPMVESRVPVASKHQQQQQYQQRRQQQIQQPHANTQQQIQQQIIQTPPNFIAPQPSGIVYSTVPQQQQQQFVPQPVQNLLPGTTILAQPPGASFQPAPQIVTSSTLPPQFVQTVPGQRVTVIGNPTPQGQSTVIYQQVPAPTLPPHHGSMMGTHTSSTTHSLESSGSSHSGMGIINPGHQQQLQVIQPTQPSAASMAYLQQQQQQQQAAPPTIVMNPPQQPGPMVQTMVVPQHQTTTTVPVSSPQFLWKTQ